MTSCRIATTTKEGKGLPGWDVDGNFEDESRLNLLESVPSSDIPMPTRPTSNGSVIMVGMSMKQQG